MRGWGGYSWSIIGFKITSETNGCLIDLFVYTLKDGHYIKAEPMCDHNTSTFILHQSFPICKYHTTIFVPFQCNVLPFDYFHEGHRELIDFILANVTCVCIFLHDDQSIQQLKHIQPTYDFESRKQMITYYLEKKKQCTKFEIIKVSTDPSCVVADFIVDDLHHYSFQYVRGDDMKDFPAKQVIEKFSIPIQYKPYNKTVSSNQLRKMENKEKTTQCR